MQQHGRLRECLLLLEGESHFYTDEGTWQGILRSFIEDYENFPGPEPLWYLEGKARLLLAQSLSKEGKAGINLEFERARECFSRAPVPDLQNHLELEVRFAELKSASSDSLNDRLVNWTAFLESDSLRVDHRMRSNSLEKAVDTAAEIIHAEPKEDTRRTLFKLGDTLELLLEQLGDIWSLYQLHTLTLDYVARLFQDWGSILKWHDAFRQKYPNVSLWELQIAAKNTALSIYQHLNHAIDEMEIVNEIETIIRARDSFWLEDGSVPSAPSLHGPQFLVIDGKIANVIGPRTTTDTKDDVGAYWFSEWGGEARVHRLEMRDPDVVNTRFLPLKDDPERGLKNEPGRTYDTLLRWLREGFAESELTGKIIQYILHLEDSPEVITTALQELTPETLRERLVGTQRSPVSSARWQTIFTILSTWLLETSTYRETKRHYLVGWLQTEVINIVRDPEDQVTELTRLIELIPKLNADARGVFSGSMPMWRNNLANAKHRIALQLSLEDPSQNPMWDDTTDAFREIMQLYQTSREECQKTGSVLHECMTVVQMIGLLKLPASKLQQPALQNFLECFDAANALFEKSRQGWKSLSGWDKTLKVLRAVEQKWFFTIVPQCISVLSAFPSSVQELRDRLIWDAIQTSKSWGLAWLMRARKVSWPEKPYAEDNDSLKIPDLTLDNLNAVAEDSSSEVVYVDWFNNTGGFDGLPVVSNSPFMVTMTAGASPKAWPIKMSWSDVHSLVEQFLRADTEQLKEPYEKQVLPKLECLVESLAKATKPGQTLVLSPVGRLHCIPIHALKIDGEYLIRRNPIVYCSSMAVMYATFQSRKAAEQRLLSTKTKFQWKPTLFGDPPAAQPAFGKKDLPALATKLGIPAPMTEIKERTTASNVKSALQAPDTNLFHYHGHAHFDDRSPEESCLQLDEPLTVRAIFDLPPSPGSSHATLLACGSGLSQTQRSNDVVGLVPALLHAGMASTVSTLWSFDDREAVAFSRRFYETFEGPMKEMGGRRIDLAKATQQAVLGIMEMTPALYYWAPFALNGYWMYRVGGAGRVDPDPDPPRDGELV